MSVAAAEFVCSFTIKGYSVWIYKRVDLLYIGWCLHSEVDSLVVQTL